MKLEVRCVGHLSADKPDPLLENAGDEADAAGEAIEAGNDDFCVLALSQLYCSLQFHARIVFPRLHVAEFRD